MLKYYQNGKRPAFKPTMMIILERKIFAMILELKKRFQSLWQGKYHNRRDDDG